MKYKGLGWAFFGALLFVFSPFLAFGGNYQVVNGPKQFYFGHVSLVDLKNDGKDPLVVREGAANPEVASLNLPLGPGDLIRTSDERRCEIEFDNGTIVRLDTDTELKIETILAHALSSGDKLSNLVLSKGRIYVMYKEYNSAEVFQVLTPNSAIKLKHNTVATVGWEIRGGTDVQVKFGKASVLYGPDPEKLASGSVYKNERLKILSDQTPIMAEYDAATEFEAWNNHINEEFVELHKGKSILPKAIQRLPEAVFYFAQKYGDLYGEWIYDDLYGYVWRPFYNETYPGGSWQPYVYGRWADYSGQMYWVPDEPWGWIPYHLGVWQWDESKGWFWLPGSAFAPAWADWAFFAGSYYAWRPWSVWDWLYFDSFYGLNSLYDPFFSWRYGYGSAGGYFGADFGTRVSSEPSNRELLTKVSKDQLQKPGKSPLPMPSELKAVYGRVSRALKNGDQRVLSSLRAASRQTLVVKATDLNSPRIQDKAARLESTLGVIRARSSGDPRSTLLELRPVSWADSSSSARRTFSNNVRAVESASRADRARQSGAKGGPAAPVRILPPAIRDAISGSGTRLHDWNSDARIGRLLGVDIVYRSRTNEVYCPQLSISSNMVHARPILSSGGADGGRASGGSYSAGSGGSSGSSGGSASSGSSSGSSSSGGGGGHIRN